MINYVVGFAFSVDGDHVALIRKTRPKWQAGCLNGIGGHIDTTDINDAAAQTREFLEETGVVIAADQWQVFAVLRGQDYRVTCFRAFTDSVYEVTTKSDEGHVGVSPVHIINEERCISNLRYLIPLALDRDQKAIAHFEY